MSNPIPTYAIAMSIDALIDRKLHIKAAIARLNAARGVISRRHYQQRLAYWLGEQEAVTNAIYQMSQKGE